VDTTNNYGPFCKLVQDLKNSLKAELKKDEPDIDSVVAEFNSAVAELVAENPEMFAYPTSSEPTGLPVYPISPNFSGGPIAGKDYDKLEEQEEEGGSKGMDQG
jgi:hypothetical protein